MEAQDFNTFQVDVAAKESDLFWIASSSNMFVNFNDSFAISGAIGERFLASSLCEVRSDVELNGFSEN